MLAARDYLLQQLFHRRRQAELLQMVEPMPGVLALCRHWRAALEFNPIGSNVQFEVGEAMGKRR